MHFDIDDVRVRLFKIYKSQLAAGKYDMIIFKYEITGSEVYRRVRQCEKIKEISDIEFATLNSVEYIKFVVLVETEYDFEFLPEDLKMGRFGCFEDIVEYVYKRITDNNK